MGERYLDAVEVAGSIPTAPTIYPISRKHIRIDLWPNAALPCLRPPFQSEIEKYNTIRRHSSLGYKTPSQTYKASMKMREVA